MLPGFYIKEIDVNKEFKKETNNNILEDKNIQAIFDEFRSRAGKEYFSRYVDRTKIVENDYNLSVSTALFHRLRVDREQGKGKKNQCWKKSDIL